MLYDLMGFIGCAGIAKFENRLTGISGRHGHESGNPELFLYTYEFCKDREYAVVHFDTHSLARKML